MTFEAYVRLAAEKSRKVVCRMVKDLT